MRSVLESRKRGRKFVSRCSMKVGGTRSFWQETEWFWTRGEKVPEAKSRVGDERGCVVDCCSKELGS